MREAYLEVTYRHGKPFAAYYYLPWEDDRKVHHTRCVESGLVIDYTKADEAIGIEITSPGDVTLTVFNELLRELGQEPIPQQEFAPLDAA